MVVLRIDTKPRQCGFAQPVLKRLLASRGGGGGGEEDNRGQDAGEDERQRH
jgi:hypothetical protein